ncbi:MAG TPA: isoprenyl transferase, partial [Tissierellaceae bacterium]
FGHQEGVKRVIDIVEEASQLGIEHLTLYAFSTENWKRPEKEIEGLMKLLVYFINKELDRLNKNNVKIKTLGDITKLPKTALKEVERAIETTKDNTGLVLNIALNYGGRDEIINGVKEVVKDVQKGNISIDDIDEKLFSEYLYTKGQPDPDLMIRASGELRISNFLLYQIAYSEFWFSNILWPDFTKERFIEAIIDYQKRDRRFGGV